MLQSRRDQIESLLLTLNIQLFPEQAPAFWCEAKSTVSCWGEGAGKSAVGALKAVLLGITEPRARLGWVMGADFEDAYKELVGTHPEDLSVVNIADRLGLLDRDGSTISTHPDQQCRVHLYAPPTLLLPAIDLTITSVSGYDPLKIGRDEPDFIIGAEVSRWDVELWRRAQARLARHPWSWGYFSGSPETDRHWFPEVFQLGQGPNEEGIESFSMPSSANRVLYPLGEEDPALVRLRAGMTADRYAARHLGIPTRTRDSVLPEFKQRLHVFPVSYVPGYPVYVWMDPGYKTYAVEFVQVVGEEVHVLEGEVYLSRPTHEQVIRQAQSQAMWKYVREGVIDVAGRQNHFGMGTPEEAWVRETGIRLRAQYHKLSETVERLRSALMVNPVTQRPRLIIHPSCRGLIGELGGGPSPLADRDMWRMTNGVPRDDNNDAAKAIGYGLLANFGTTRPSQNEEGVRPSRPVSYLQDRNQRAEQTLERLLRRSR